MPWLSVLSLSVLSLAGLVLALASGCGAPGSQASVEPPASVRSARAHWDGSLVDLIPARATVAVVARPQELLREPATRAVVAAIASDERLERYRQHTGIDPRRLEQLVWAETDEGSILLVRGPLSAPLAVVEMAHRMLPVESSAEEPFVRRVGHYQGGRRDLVALSEHVLLAVTGSPALAEEVLGRALGGARDGALSPEPVASLCAAHADAPLYVVAPQPLGLPHGTPLALLLARERALFVAASPAGEGEIGLVADLRGEFPPGADANFRALAESVAQSDLGAALGMTRALSTLTVDAGAERVVLRATFPAPVLAAGLRVLFEAEIAEIVGPPEPSAEVGLEPDAATVQR